MQNNEKRSLESDIDCLVDHLPGMVVDPTGVGGRQIDTPPPARGGGYQDVCTASNFRPPAARDPRLDELRVMGLQETWLAIADEIGYDAFMAVWRIIDGNPAHRDDDGVLRPPAIRSFGTYLRFQRNRYIEMLTSQGATVREIRELVRRSLCETVSERHISRLARANKLKSS